MSLNNYKLDTKKTLLPNLPVGATKNGGNYVTLLFQEIYGVLIKSVILHQCVVDVQKARNVLSVMN